MVCESHVHNQAPNQGDGSGPVLPAEDSARGDYLPLPMGPPPPPPLRVLLISITSSASLRTIRGSEQSFALNLSGFKVMGLIVTRSIVSGFLGLRRMSLVCYDQTAQLSRQEEAET